MSVNRETLDWLFSKGKIHLTRGPIFDVEPLHQQAELDWDRVEGMMLGLAIGDALGAPTEGLRPRFRRKIFGEIRNYLENPHTGESKGYPSDDTQLAFWTLEQMLADDGFVPENLARCFCKSTIFGLGNSINEFLRRHLEEGLPWYESGPSSAGNGALMRIAPMVIPHLATGTSELWVDTALSAMITHNDPASISACISFVRILWDLLQMDKTPSRDWWCTTYMETASQLEGEGRYRPRGGRYTDYEGPMWRYIGARTRYARDKRLSVKEACDEWWSAAYLLETLPSVLYILTLHGHDPKRAIVRAVNDTMDNDTIAAIVGAAVGALHGRLALPRRWITMLTGRTRAEDDGRIFELLDAAYEKWGTGSC